MRPVEGKRKQTQKGSAGHNQPGGFRVYFAQGLRSEASPKNAANRNPLGEPKPIRGELPILRSQPRRLGLERPFRHDPARTPPL